jgi:hypothetical protein
MIEEKNPLHREYGLFSNINYVLQGMRKYSKILMWMLPIGFVISPIQRYLWSFITKFVIDIVTNNSGVKKSFICYWGFFGYFPFGFSLPDFLQ